MLGSRARAARLDRAMDRLAFLAEQAGEFDRATLDDAVSGKLAEPTPKSPSKPKAAQPKGFPTGDVSRWVPIGPSVVRRGQGQGRPRTTGRIRDLAIDATGKRAYAASARGGVWYTEDGGSTWAPVGGWAERQVGIGGPNNAQSCGALLVSFGATAADDFVMAGTGETTPGVGPNVGQWGGLGVLVGKGAAAQPVGANPWEVESGLALLQGLGIFRLARDPASTPGSTAGPTTDRVLAATSGGLFLGTRHAGPPDSFTWAKLGGIDTLVAAPSTFHSPAPPAVPASPVICDLLWLPNGAASRIVLAVRTRGLAISDDGGTTFKWVGGLNWPVSGQTVQGCTSIAVAPGTTAVYALTGLRKTPGLPKEVEDDTALFRVADITAATPAAVRVTGVPVRLWPGQRDYDQAICVDVVADGANPAKHRIYLGGSYFDPASSTYDASLWCFEPSAANRLGPVSGISKKGDPGTGDGAVTDGHIGPGVHADVHVMRLAGPAAARHLWVGCDGGVYVSASAGRVNTFAPRNIGLATLEAGFTSSHPRLSQLVAAGFQDNGTQIRTGDTAWEEVFQGDGGGVMFDPVQPHRVVGEYVRASWSADPAARFVSPTSRIAGGGTFVGDREDTRAVSSFYSGGAATVTATGTTRLAVGTNRIWITDDLGTANPNTWRALRFPNGASADVRPNGNDPQPRFGVPAGALGLPAMAAHAASGPLGSVITLKWASPTVLVAMFQFGVVTWTETAPGSWSAAFGVDWTTLPGNLTFTDVAPVPGSSDYYVATTGDSGDPTCDTCYFYDATAKTTTPTKLRNVLDVAGPPAQKGPLDPAYAVVVDPAKPLEVYVGTVTGVWHGVRTAGTSTVTWGNTPFVNGLPQAGVQDLALHYDPAHPAPRLLRAALQARGVWEVDLAANEPVRTYLRVHPFDDRRRLPTALADPRTPPPTPPAAAPTLNSFESPDIIVHPKSGAAISPSWQLPPAGQLNSANAPTYQLWTFQTAFRWLFPSVLATGQWSPTFERLVRVQRAVSTPATPGNFIDKALWDAVMATRVDPVTGAASNNAAHPLAVYREPWHTPVAQNAGATEVDLVECVQPVTSLAGVWGVYKEKNTVEVLLHHRDTRPVPARQSHAVLFWRSDPSQPTLLGLGIAELTVYLANCVSTGKVQAAPGGWNVAGPAAGTAVASLGVPLDARIPRAMSFDVDLSGVDANHFVVFIAVAWSDGDLLTQAPVGLPVAPAVPTLLDLVRGWPYAALRLVQVTPRPV